MPDFALLADPPKGLVVRETETGWVIVCALQGFALARWLIACLAVAFGAAAVMAARMSHDTTSPAQFESPDMALWMALVFGGSALLMAGIWVRLFIVRTSLILERDALVIEHSLGRWRRTRRVPWNTVRGVHQRRSDDPEVKTPSWCLIIEAERDIRLLPAQTREMSDWLGPVLADWAGKKFGSAS